jgi:hypothetical protein
MNKMLKGLTFAALIARSLLGSTSDAFAKDTKHGRETAWTLPAPDVDVVVEPFDDGVTWEEVFGDGVTWEE